ncbi:VaFE repeat-containing surface-anchored protein [Clostridiales Family XIII bacterium WCA-MUC-591-APC-3H]|uniref:VaFE repeat-containing surface-anchored protein n=1 Tax=Hornefia butyriciproducens TaxID=2652293 RepID=A0A6L5Y865_9FIRM|nr:VaFE repeat-containing surface-anchored protein [Hornefia butyriciproducens]
MVTDKNGFFSTKDRRAAGDLDEEEGKDNARRQNPFDDLLNEKQISTEALKKRAEQIRCGVFFGTGQFGSKASMIAGAGALPYDTYTIEEMRCENNKGYVLQKFSFTVDEKTRTGTVDLETITDDLITIGTKAKAENTGMNLSAAEKDVKLMDTVSYTNLVPGKEYVLKGKLMDQKTGKELLVNGKPVISQQKFVPEKKDGTVDVEFVFSGAGLAGTSTVVFEDLYENDVNIASHADIHDEGQTIHFPEVKTHAEDRKTKDEVGETHKETTIVDKVNYRNLIPGKEYTVKGVLMDKETGKPVMVKGKKVTSEKKFTAHKADGTVEMSFTFDASSLKGKTTVVFEDLFYEGVKVASHADLSDKDQTVHFPKKPDTPPETPAPPKTGDRTKLLGYIALMLAAGTTAAGIAYKKRQMHKFPEDQDDLKK